MLGVGGDRELDPPEPVADQRYAPAACVDAGHLELRAADHDVEVRRRAVDRARGRLRPRAPEAAAEGDVRGGVLVEQRVVVDTACFADAGGGVDERDLAEPAPAFVRVDVGGDEVAIVLRIRVETDEPASRELAAQAVDEAAAEGE